MNIWQLILTFWQSLLVYGPSEVGEGTGSFFGGDDDDDGDEGDDAADDDAVDDEGHEADDTDDVDDEDESEEDDDSEDDDDGGESEDDSESEGDGADEGEEPELDRGTAAMALETSVRARLSATKPGDDAGAIDIDMPSVADIAKDFPDMHEDDIKGIHAVSKAIVERTLASYDSARIDPMVKTSSATQRKSDLEAGVRDFMKKYPGAFEAPGVQAAMSEKYTELAEAYGADVADTVTVEEYYLMVGGTPNGSKKVPTRKATAARQKRKAKAATNRPGSVGRIATGKKRKPRKDEALLRETQEAIRVNHIDPFRMPG